MLCWLPSGITILFLKSLLFPITEFQLLRIFIPYTIRAKYENQEDLEYTFTTKDGSIELSKFALQHSDFYREQCEGPDSFAFTYLWFAFTYQWFEKVHKS